jgi:hypothetical protein
MKPLKVTQKENKAYLEGPFLDLLKPPQGRRYDRDSLFEQIREIQEDVANGKILGELGHPERFEVNLSNVSHKILELWIDPVREELLGRIEILQTPKGLEAKLLIDNKIPLSVGMRAYVREDDNGLIHIDKIYSFDLIQYII